jgi:hypothetical protein
MASTAASGGWSDADALAALREDGPTGTAGGAGKKEQDAAFAGDAAPSSSSSSATATATDGDSDDWRTLYRTIVGSLRASSSSIFRDLSLETVVLGFRALTTAHASARDDLPGEPVLSARRDAALVDALLDAARWALAFDASRRTSQDLASYLRVSLECVRYFASEASPLEPAHAVVVDPAAPVLHVVVRGTTSWHDALTDLVAHTEELASDDEYEEEEEEDLEEERSNSASPPRERAHAGMLRAARALHRRHTPLLVELLSGECAGYRVHCVGFSLGAGTASLLAHLWRRRRRRGQADGDKEVSRLASAVECTALGCPPTVTPRLARRMGRGGRTPGRTLALVHNHDMIPRMSVASLAELRAELESHASQASSASPLARWVRETGALTATQRAAGQLLSLAAAAGAARAFGGGGGGGVAAAAAGSSAGNGALGRFMRAGFAAGAGALADKFKELHASAMQEGVEQGGEAQQKEQGGDVYSGPGGGEPAPVPLACPGEVLFLRREEEGSSGNGAAYELRRCPVDGKRPGRILLKRSMLRDHYLTHMVRALRSVKEGQMLA